MAEVVLVRHGETEWSRLGRHTGRTDVPLTAYGETQARALGGALAGRDFGLVLVSPLQRAWRTAELAGLPDPQREDAAMEWDYGGSEGRTTPEIREEHPGWTIWSAGVLGGGVTAGETAAEVGARAGRVLARARPVLEAGRDVAVVAHGHLLRVLTAVWLGLDPLQGARFELGAAAVSVLGYEHELPVLRHWNQPNPTPDQPVP